MKKKIELAIILLLIAGLIMCSKHLEKYAASDKVEAKKHTVIIDAGHGGGDPGKVGINKALEKDINLKIAKKVEKLLEKKGIDVVMTRESDSSLAKDKSGSQKIQDMKARVELINETKPELSVSIHQNSFQQESVHGAQVFYYKHSPQGEKAAKIMQEAMRVVDEGNTKEAKADDTYYLLKRTKFPVIIVECGFLSNYNEAEKLVSKEYQSEMAKAITSGILACLED